MREINTYIHEARERRTGGRFSNAGSDIDTLIWDWLIRKYCTASGRTLVSLQSEFNKAKDSIITSDHKICKMTLQKILSSGIFELSIYDDDLLNGEFPEYIKFDKPIYSVNMYNVKDLKNLNNIPPSSQKLNILNCPGLRDLTGLPDMRKLSEVYINGCHNLRSLTGAEKIKKAREILIDNCPDLQSVDAISNCKVSGDNNGTGELRFSRCGSLDITSGIISKITKGSKDMSIGLDRKMLEDLRDANMYHEFDGIENIRYFNIYDADDPDTAIGLLEDMIPWDKLQSTVINKNISRVRLYGCTKDKSYQMYGMGVIGMTAK